VRKSGRLDLRARSKNTGDKNAKATSNAKIHRGDRVIAQQILNDLGVETQ
jgi:hypothetical protein